MEKRVTDMKMNNFGVTYSFPKSLPLILTPLDPLTNVNQDVKEESEVPVLREEEEEKEASSLEFNHKNKPLTF